MKKSYKRATGKRGRKTYSKNMRYKIWISLTSNPNTPYEWSDYHNCKAVQS